MKDSEDYPIIPRNMMTKKIVMIYNDILEKHNDGTVFMYKKDDIKKKRVLILVE